MSRFLLPLAVLLGCCSGQTSLLLIVGGDLEPVVDMDRVEASASEGGTPLGSKTYGLSPGDELPLSFRLPSTFEGSGQVELSVSAWLDGEKVVEATRSVSSVRGEEVELRYCLWRGCTGSEDERCLEGSCEVGDGDADADADPDAEVATDAGADRESWLDGELDSDSRDADGDDEPPVVVIRNFPDLEIYLLQGYLADMNLRSRVHDEEGLSLEAIEDAALVIWNDLSFRTTTNTAAVLILAYEAGIPLYLIGDDLANAPDCCLSEPLATEWESLIHLDGLSNISDSEMVRIVDLDHPVTRGSFGRVADFGYGLDMDASRRTSTGEVLLATAGPDDIIVAFEDPTAGTRLVTQNVLLYYAIGPEGRSETEKLFKNAVDWLLTAP